MTKTKTIKNISYHISSAFLFLVRLVKTIISLLCKACQSQLLEGKQEQIMLIDLRRSVLGVFRDPTPEKVLNAKSEHTVDMS